MALSSGKYYPETALGKVFILSTAAAGTAFPLATGTAMTFGMWNTSVNKNAVLMKLNVGYTSGTIAIGEVGLVNIAGGAQVATGGNITAFTDAVQGTTIRNGILGSGLVSDMRATPSAATVVAGSGAYWTGGSMEIATAAPGVSVLSHDFDGSVIVPPGQAVFVVGSVAQTGLFTMSLSWAEVAR